MKVLFTDTRMPEIGLERKFFADAGIELKVAQCATEEDVIRESEGCAALLITYAKVGLLSPGTASSLPQIRQS